jgi:hypothetical protein
MPEFQLTHVALVGARMSAFEKYGFSTRNELSMCRVPPDSGSSLAAMPEQELRLSLGAELPVWVHNIIADPGFPGRDSFLMPLRRFEGELFDSRSDDVVSAVLSAGFKDQTLDPLDLPVNMPMRQRCALVMQVTVWQEAYRALEQDLVDILVGRAAQLDEWCKRASNPDGAFIE